MKKILLLFTLLSTMLLASCDKEPLYNDYVQLSWTSYTFDYNDEKTLEVEVKTNNDAAWDVTAESADWLTYEKKDNLLMIKAKQNETSEERVAILSVVSGQAKAEIHLNQMPYGFYGNFMDFPLSSLGGVSRNGKYAGYINVFYDENKNLKYECRIIDTETLEETTHEVTNVISDRGEDTKIPYCQVQCISNDGSTILYMHPGQAHSIVKVNDEKLKLEMPKGYANPRPSYFSADASVIVGYCKSTNEDRMTLPIVWRNGVPEVLEVPEFIADGSPLYKQGVMARGCSEDGSVVYGSEWKHYGLIYWKDGKMVDIGSKYAEIHKEGKLTKVALIQQTSTTTNISPNGKFIAAYYNATGGNAVGALFYPVVVNTETGEATIYEQYAGYMGIHAMNDGTIFVMTQAATAGYCVIDYKSGELKSLPDWTEARYGFRLPDTRLIDMITSDESVLFGKKYYRGGMGTMSPSWFLRR